MFSKEKNPMPPTLDEQAAKERFLQERELAHAPARLAVERAVCGSPGCCAYHHHLFRLGHCSNEEKYR